MIFVAFIFVLLIGAAHSEDYWSTCEQAYQFCEQHGYHRDCSIWTMYGEPLSVNSYHYGPRNPNLSTDFCKQNQWHMACGWGQKEEFVHTECPIPDRFNPVNGVMPWAVPAKSSDDAD